MNAIPPAALSTSNLVQPPRASVMRYARQAAAGGPVVETLEARLAAFHDVPFCIAVCNGFWALVLAIGSLALPGRTDVLMPSLTYRRMADVVAWTGLRPRFCEVDPATLACDAATMRAALTPEIALLLAVHPIVGCCDVAGIEALASEQHLPLLFDAVESAYEHVAHNKMGQGKMGQGKVGQGKVGRFGDAECFSLHASKLLNGFEGGYLTTRDAALATRLAALRDGRAGPGMDLRLDALHAAMALASLDDLEDQVRRNRERYEAYRARLAPIPGLHLVPFDGALPTSYKNILVELLPSWPLGRDATVARLNARGMLARAYYHPPLHAKPMAYPHVPAHLPLTDALASRYVLLPCGHHVSLAGIDQVAAALSDLGRGAG